MIHLLILRMRFILVCYHLPLTVHVIFSAGVKWIQPRRILFLHSAQGWNFIPVWTLLSTLHGCFLAWVHGHTVFPNIGYWLWLSTFSVMHPICMWDLCYIMDDMGIFINHIAQEKGFCVPDDQNNFFDIWTGQTSVNHPILLLLVCFIQNYWL